MWYRPERILSWHDEVTALNTFPITGPLWSWSVGEFTELVYQDLANDFVLCFRMLASTEMVVMTWASNYIT